MARQRIIYYCLIQPPPRHFVIDSLAETYPVPLRASTDRRHHRPINLQQALFPKQQLLFPNVCNQITNVIFGVPSDSVEIVSVLVGGFCGGLLLFVSFSLNLTPQNLGREETLSQSEGD